MGFESLLTPVNANGKHQFTSKSRNNLNLYFDVCNNGVDTL